MASCSPKSPCTTGEQRRIKRWEHEAIIDAMQERRDRAPDSPRSAVRSWNIRSGPSKRGWERPNF